jgi:hypothetical protein
LSGAAFKTIELTIPAGAGVSNSFEPDDCRAIGLVTPPDLTGVVLGLEVSTNGAGFQKLAGIGAIFPGQVTLVGDATVSLVGGSRSLTQQQLEWLLPWRYVRLASYDSDGLPAVEAAHRSILVSIRQ